MSAVLLNVTMSQQQLNIKAIWPIIPILATLPVTTSIFILLEY